MSTKKSPTENLPLSALIARARIKKRLTQGALAKRLGLKQNTVSAWEKNRSVPRDPNLWPKLQGALGIPARVIEDLVLSARFGEEPVLGSVHETAPRYRADPCLQDVLARLGVVEGKIKLLGGEVRDLQTKVAFPAPRRGDRG